MSVAIEVINPGFLSSVQDLGRTGWAHIGVSAGGAADPQALMIGNRLIGNLESAAAIEMTMVGGSFRFHQSAWVALTGADCQPRVDGIPMAMWYGFQVCRGETLSIGSVRSGARSYLCVHGGVDVPEVLGSRSTDLGGGWGGWQGRALKSEDHLSLGRQTQGVPSSKRAGLYIRSLYRFDEKILRVTQGPQWSVFTQEAQRALFESEFVVTSEADRKGLRLQGPELRSALREELVTEGVANGAIQVPASGHPLILFCEQHTTGGYPKIANVIRADWYLLGQLRPGDKIRFAEVSLEEAWRLIQEREKMCRSLLI